MALMYGVMVMVGVDSCKVEVACTGVPGSCMVAARMRRGDKNMEPVGTRGDSNSSAARVTRWHSRRAVTNCSSLDFKRASRPTTTE